MSLMQRLFSAWSPGSAPDSARDILAGQYRRVEPQLPPPTAPGKMRIHLFSGVFESSAAAWHYCYSHGPDRPEELTRDLPDAYIDTSHVEVRFEDFGRRLDEFLLPADVAAVVHQMDGANTLVIIAEPAFGGLAYALNDTPRLRYLGPMVVMA